MRTVETIDLPRSPGPRKYRKKPVVIEAIEWTGTNGKEIWEFTEYQVVISKDTSSDVANLSVATLEGLMAASIGDFIIKGVAGEFYPCKPDIFKQTYEEVTENEWTPEDGNYGRDILS